VVGVSRRPRIVSDGDEAPVDQPGENFSRRSVGSCQLLFGCCDVRPQPNGNSGIDSHVDGITTLERGGLEFEV
jgi:hypothetical protein